MEGQNVAGWLAFGKRGATMTTRPLRTVTIRMPAEILDAIEALAELGDRSTNAQIVRMLRGIIEGETADKG